VGPLGRRLKAMLGRGDPKVETPKLRLYAPTPVEGSVQAQAFVAELESSISTIQKVLNVPATTEMVTLFVIPEADALKAFVTSLELSSLAGEGPLPGTFSVTTTGRNLTLKRSLVSSLGARAPRAPGWVPTGLAMALDVVPFRDKPTVPLAVLEKVSTVQLQKDPKLFIPACQYACVALKPEGAAALGAYVSLFPTDPVKARADLEAYVRRAR
jgi:hypothetical protein